jgi:hypothetical protein
MQNTAFLTDADIRGFIQESSCELYDLLIESAGAGHFASSVDLTTSPGVSYIDLIDDSAPHLDPDLTPLEDAEIHPLNVYKLLSVQVNVDGHFRSIRPVDIAETASFSDLSGWTSRQDVFYLISTILPVGGDTGGVPYRRLSFYPTPTGAHSVRLVYIPTPQPLVDATEELLGTWFLHYAHWTEYVVVDATAKCLEVEESDASPLYRRLDRLMTRIQWHARTMDIGDQSGGQINDSVSRFGRSPDQEPFR